MRSAAAMLHDVGHALCAPSNAKWSRARGVDAARGAPGTAVHGVRIRPCRAASRRSSPASIPLPYLARSVAATFDVDRCDYLLRSAHADRRALRHLRLAAAAAFASRRARRRTRRPRSQSTAPRGCPGASDRAPLHVPAGLPAQGDNPGDGPSQAARLIADSRGPHSGSSCTTRTASTSSSTTRRSPSRSAEQGRTPRDLARRIARARALQDVRACRRARNTNGERALSQSRATWLAARPTCTSDSTSRATCRSRPSRSRSWSTRRASRGRLSEVSFLLSRLKGETLARVRLVFAPELREAITGAVGAGARMLLPISSSSRCWRAPTWATRATAASTATSRSRCGAEDGASARGVSGVLDVRFRYLQTAGLFTTYEEGFGAGAEPLGVLTGGIELRPLFLGAVLPGPRARLAVRRPAHRLAGVRRGRRFVAQPAGGQLADVAGLSFGVGLRRELHRPGRASTPFVGLRAAVVLDREALSAANPTTSTCSASP